MGQQVQPPSPNIESIKRKMASRKLQKEATSVGFGFVLEKVEKLDALSFQGISNQQERLKELGRLTLSEDEKKLLSKLSDPTQQELDRFREVLHFLHKLQEKDLI